MSKKIFQLLSVTTLLISTVVFADDTTNNSNKIAAVVNDQIITQSELSQMISAVTDQQKANPTQKTTGSICKQAMDQLIARDVQLQIAKAAKITVSADELNTALAQIAADHQIPVEKLKDALTEQGLNYDQYIKQLTQQLTIQKFQQQQLSGTINIPQKEIDKLAQKLQADQKNTVQTFYHFQAMLIPLPPKPTPADFAQAKQTFDTIAADINQNEDFASISQKILGKPPQDFGWRSGDQIPPEFLAIATKMTPGQVAPPVRTPNGVQLLRLIEKKAGAAPQPVNMNITETEVQHILLKSDKLTPSSTLERRLLTIRDSIVNGGVDFSGAAEKYSEDPGSAYKGGNLDWVKPDTLDPKFEAAMNKLKIGEISQPVQSQYGWHLIKVIARRQINDPATAWKIKAQQILFQQKMEVAIKQMISQLRAQAYIKVFDKSCS